jgi:ubiquinone/menaquinone biosynthesis C-methylase UbiE
VLAHLPAEEQFQALNEIYRVLGEGSRAYIGPVNPQRMNFDKIPESFQKFKNPFFGYIKNKNINKEGLSVMYKNLLPNTAVYKNSENSKSMQFLYRSSFPIYSLYVMSMRATFNKLLPKWRIRKDHKARLPFEQYITVVK